jgi:hypothetical protein
MPFLTDENKMNTEIMARKFKHKNSHGLEKKYSRKNNNFVIANSKQTNT